MAMERTAENFDSRVAKAKIVALNKDIAKFAKEKNLTRAQECFQIAVSSGSPNSHTFAAMINAYVRCGQVDEAYAIYESLRLKSHRVPLDVISCTTMMKGFCGVGKIDTALKILDDMIGAKPKVMPNIRTINTFLRGCVFAGSLKLAEEIFPRINHEFRLTPDISSWEYLVTLLSQGLVIDKILPIIGRLRNDNTISGGVAAMCINLSRAAAVLTEFKIGRRYLSLATQLLESEEKNSTSNSCVLSPEFENAQKETRGGKQSWKHMDPDDARAQSLEVYQEHRRAELRQEISSINNFMELEGITIERNLLYFKRILLFNHVNANQEDGTRFQLVDQLLTALVTSLGFDKALHMRENGHSSRSIEFQINRSCPPDDEKSLLRKSKKKSKRELKPMHHSTTKILVTEQVAQGLTEVREYLDHCFTTSTYLNFNQLFGNDSPQLPLKLEICSGFGEWIVKQAKADNHRANWIALELKQDRVYQTFTRSIFEGATNLATICGDALKVLPNYFPDSSLSFVYVNYPEPPQQLGGDDTQSKHLLTQDFFSMIDRVLTIDGVMTILTDNLWYGRLLLKVISSNSHERHFVNVETQSVVQESLRGFTLYNGKPGADCGHNVDTTSYFDRLWQRGRQPDRYYLVLRKSTSSSLTLNFGRSTKRSVAQMQLTNTNKKIKFSEEEESES